MALKRYEGSCHCKNIQYEVMLDLNEGTGRCNCSYCAKTRNWSAKTTPEKFKWVKGANTTGSYGFRENSQNKHHFCKDCGVTVCTIGFVKETGGDYVSVRIGTIDNISAEELASLSIMYLDGLHDNWFHEPKVVSYL